MSAVQAEELRAETLGMPGIRMVAQPFDLNAFSRRQRGFDLEPAPR
jgi:hypothetical protein